MVFSATVVNVMIGGPADVEDEVNTVRNTIAEWNNAHAARRSVVLLPMHWKTHATPATGGTPQSFIDKQIVAQSDALIAIFKGSVGTASPDGQSGTMHEIDDFVAHGKSVQVYFHGSPTVRSGKDAERAKQLFDFKEEFKTRGLYGEYADAVDLGGKVLRHLELLVGPAGPPTGAAAGSPKEVELSEKASALLTAAAASKQHIQSFKFIAGLASIGAGGVGYEGKDPREIAAWEAAVEELEKGRFVRPNDNRKLFFVTDAGYKFADRVAAR